MNIDFTGATVIVTGAAHGIGNAITHGLASRGATVWASDIIEVDPAEPPAGDGRIVRRVVDVTDKSQLASLAAEASADSGRVDILVCVAGGVRGQVGQPVEDVPEEQWHSIYEVSLKGAFLSAQAVVPGMKAAGGGRILVISSGAGLGVSLTGIQAYGSAKAGQIGLVRQLAH